MSCKVISSALEIKNLPPSKFLKASVTFSSNGSMLLLLTLFHLVKIHPLTINNLLDQIDSLGLS